jgi:hypothetical protein
VLNRAIPAKGTVPLGFCFSWEIVFGKVVPLR